MARPRLSFKKEDNKYIDDRLNILLNLYSKGKALENACGRARISDVVIRKYLDKKNELYNKDENYVYTTEEEEIMEFITDFAYARSEGQDVWLKPIEEFRDNPKEAHRKGSADNSISMIKLLYVEFRDKKEDKEEKGILDKPILINDIPLENK